MKVLPPNVYSGVGDVAGLSKMDSPSNTLDGKRYLAEFILDKSRLDE